MANQSHWLPLLWMRRRKTCLAKRWDLQPLPERCQSQWVQRVALAHTGASNPEGRETQLEIDLLGLLEARPLEAILLAVVMLVPVQMQAVGHEIVQVLLANPRS